MPLLDFIEGKEVEWDDVSIAVEGAELVKPVGFRYGIKAEKEELYAKGVDAISIQSGNKSKTFTIKVLKGDYDVMHDAALAANGDDITDLEFDIAIKYAAKGERGLRLVVLQGCEIEGFEEGMDQNAKSMVVELSGKYLKYIRSKN